MRTKGAGGRGGSQLEDDTVVWEDPPEISRVNHRRSKYVAILTPLMKHPGRWAKVMAFEGRATAQSTVGQFRKYPERLPAPLEEWEFTARKSEDGSYLYARYIGPGGEEKP